MLQKWLLLKEEKRTLTTKSHFFRVRARGISWINSTTWIIRLSSYTWFSLHLFGLMYPLPLLFCLCGDPFIFMIQMEMYSWIRQVPSGQEPAALWVSTSVKAEVLVCLLLFLFCLISPRFFLKACWEQWAIFAEALSAFGAVTADRQVWTRGVQRGNPPALRMQPFPRMRVRWVKWPKAVG